MTAEQGFEIYKCVQMQMNPQEQEKFKQLILEQVEDFETKVKKCLARLNKKYPNKGRK